PQPAPLQAPNATATGAPHPHPQAAPSPTPPPTPGSGLRNLTTYQPASWSDKIVVSNVAGTVTDAPTLLTTDSLYVDWVVRNIGTAPTSGSFLTNLYVDNVLVSQWWTTVSVPVNLSTYALDYPIGSLVAGTHTVKIVADSTNAIAESNEYDNEYIKTIVVQNPGGPLPNLTPYKPAIISAQTLLATLAA